MSEKTAPFPWAELFSERTIVEVTEAHIAHIRGLCVCWEAVENGAAGLTDAEDDDGTTPTPDNIEDAIAVFLQAATLPVTSGRVRNPFAGIDLDDDAFMLDDTPDQTVADLLRAGADFDFVATETDLALWAEANRGAEGIDPKRPFGTENPSRDVRRLVDPDKTLSNAAFSKRRKQLESRQMLMLLFFIQNAQLEPGTWRMAEEDGAWRRLQPGEPLPHRMLTRCEWIDALYRRHHYECQDYTATIHCLQKLVFDDRVRGSYAEMTRQFKLDNLFGGEMRAEHVGSAEEHLRTALGHFPDRRGGPETPWFTLALVRMLNAQARWAEARAALEAADLFDIDRKDVQLDHVDALNCAYLEGLIARNGLGLIPDDEFNAILCDTHRRWKIFGRRSLSSFVRDLRYHPERYEDDAQPPGVTHARALVAQLELMEGPYRPEYEPTWFN